MRCLLVVCLISLAGCRCDQRLVRSCTPEICDGIDNNCDGLIDEGFEAIVCGTGECQRTINGCVEGKPLSCIAGTAGAELCNGVDDDCNGLVDDGFSVARCGVGACAREVALCSNGSEEACVAGAPTNETCNGKDDDCDGEIDEGLLGASCGLGACRRSVNLCSDMGTCVPGMPSTETCNGIDDDCDGQIDEGLCDAPTVSCGGPLLSRTGQVVDATGQVVTSSGAVIMRWNIESAPAGSTAALSNAMQATTSFTPDVGGEYRVRFCVTDDTGVEACCVTAVTVSACMAPPAPPVGTACGTSWDGRPIVTFPRVAAGVHNDLIDVSGVTLASAASGSNWVRPAVRVGAGGPVPGAATQLRVRTCLNNDLACCSDPTTMSVNIVEPCTAPIAASAGNVVISEYVVNGEGSCTPTDCFVCQAGEAVEITNLSNCPVTLEGTHFKYRNAAGAAGSVRWMNFGTADVIPPRGVYVAIRGRNYAPTCSASLPAESTSMYGLKVSMLAMQGDNLCSGWFNNIGGGQSEMQLAVGTVSSQADLNFGASVVLSRISPYQTGSTACASTGFDALDSCGSIVGGSMPTSTLSPNQLGRLWHPCDAVVSPSPACVRP